MSKVSFCIQVRLEYKNVWVGKSVFQLCCLYVLWGDEVLSGLFLITKSKGNRYGRLSWLVITAEAEKHFTYMSQIDIHQGNHLKRYQRLILFVHFWGQFINLGFKISSWLLSCFCDMIGHSHTLSLWESGCSHYSFITWMQQEKGKIQDVTLCSVLG